MNCAEFDVELNRVLDRRTGEELAVLQPHAEQCADCRQALDRARGLLEAITAWRGAVPEVDLANAVVLACAEVSPSPAAIENQSSKRSVQTAGSVVVTASSSRHQRRAIYATLVALSSMLLLAVYLLSSNPESPTIVEKTPGLPREAPANKPPVDPELALLDQAGDAYGRLAKSAAGALEEFAVIVIPGAGGAVPTVRTSDSADEPLLEGLQQQLQPVGRSLGNALDFLWEVGSSPADSRT
jgi:hypothetical protein